ncbi:MAG: YceI family protein [Cytophagaceae bacterium]|nr:YceI family protein [Cytophagaceae bacterium]MDW8456023.1 YceI family protein [Cytophagaceae bacterium]
MKPIKILPLLVIYFFASVSFAQSIYMTRTGRISFHSDAPLQKIEAVTNSAISVLNIENGVVQTTVQINTFEFDKPLMQSHFNENYMESDKYPKSTFKGRIVNAKSIDWTKAGSQKIEIEGELTMHGITRNMTAQGTIEKKDSQLLAIVTFEVKLKDYEIKIPSLVGNKIAEIVEVRLNMTYDPVK